jgi:hypothetical protein
MDVATAAYYNDPTRLVATKNEVTSILPASSGAWAGWEARQQPYRRVGRRQRGGRVAGVAMREGARRDGEKLGIDPDICLNALRIPVQLAHPDVLRLDAYADCRRRSWTRRTGNLSWGVLSSHG